jgi:hypothetical protein
LTSDQRVAGSSPAGCATDNQPEPTGSARDTSNVSSGWPSRPRIADALRSKARKSEGGGGRKRIVLAWKKVDALSALTGKVSTHTDGKAYDRVLESDAISRGQGGFRPEGVVIQEHRHGKGEERPFYTNYFPGVVTIKP